MIIYTAIQNIPDKLWTDSFVAVNLYPHHRLSFSGWIKNIALAVKTGETAYFWNHIGSYYDAISSVWKNATIIKIRELIYVIDSFTAETPNVNSLWTKRNILSIIYFVPLDQTARIKICHMVASEHPDVIEGRRRLIATNVLYSEEASEDGSIDNYGADFD